MVHLDTLLGILKNEEVSLNNSATADNALIKNFHLANRCNYIEDEHAIYEGNVRPILDYLENEDLGILDNPYARIEFFNFIGHQITRTKPFRDASLERMRKGAKSPLEAKVVNLFEHCWWLISFFWGFNIGDSFLDPRYDETHVLLINETDVPFITGDVPVVNVHDNVSEIEFKAPEVSDFYYPISPRVAFMINQSKRFSGGKVQVTKDMVNELNTKVASQAMQMIVGNTDSAIRPYVSIIGNRYKRV